MSHLLALAAGAFVGTVGTVALIHWGAGRVIDDRRNRKAIQDRTIGRAHYCLVCDEPIVYDARIGRWVHGHPPTDAQRGHIPHPSLIHTPGATVTSGTPR